MRPVLLCGTSLMPPRLMLLVEDDPDFLDVLDIARTDAEFAVVIARRGAPALAEINTDVAGSSRQQMCRIGH